MESFVKIKEEPLDIKEEPLDHFSEFDHDLLVPKIEVEESTTATVTISDTAAADDLQQQESLSCPKCDIRYYSAMSIKNHIQVCKKVREAAELKNNQKLRASTQPSAVKRILVKGK